jgi:hypothetical protein
LSEDDADTKKFRAAVVSVGMFGVLSEITIRVDYAFNLVEIRTAKELNGDCLANLDKYVNGHTYVKMWVDFHHDFCALYQTERTNKTVTEPPGRLESFLMVSKHVCTGVYKVVCRDASEFHGCALQK